MKSVPLSRSDPAHYTPAHIPPAIASFADAITEGLGVGAPGKVGLLELELALVGLSTRVVKQFHRAPLHLYRPVYIDPARPDMAFVYLQQSGDGLVQGDRRGKWVWYSLNRDRLAELRAAIDS